ncbi:MAG: hypothetical protein V3U96_11335 [Paracoccaceae bacterium]
MPNIGTTPTITNNGARLLSSSCTTKDWKNIENTAMLARQKKTPTENILPSHKAQPGALRSKMLISTVFGIGSSNSSTPCVFEGAVLGSEFCMGVHQVAKFPQRYQHCIKEA